jgi:hypothetical protein
MADDKFGGPRGDDDVDGAGLGDDDTQFLDKDDLADGLGDGPHDGGLVGAGLVGAGLVGGLGGLDDEDLDDEYDFEDLDFEPLDFEDVADAIGLPDELPALRLPAEAELAEQARASSLAATLAALASWVGDEGRDTTDEGDLSEADAADAARELVTDEGDLLFLWEYALTGDWITFAGEEDEAESDSLLAFGEDGIPVLGLDHVSRGGTAREWADGSDDAVLDAWRATLSAVLTGTFDVILDSADEPIADMDLDGQGIAMAIMLFLARGEGLALTDISEVIFDTATADMEPDEAEEAREAWLDGYGDPAALITATLAQLGAVNPPSADDGAVRLTPLGLWAIREELTDIGVEVPLLPVSVTEMTAAQLLLVADDAGQEEFESESDAWVAAREPEQAARELLDVAAGDGPDSRLLAVSVVTRIGDAAEPAWRASLDTPALRAYAKIALAGLNPDSVVAAELEPRPEDLAWVATDMLVLACDEDEPDPDDLAECLGDSVPAGEEATLFDMMSRAAHPDAVDVLSYIGRHHPDARIAKEARTAAHHAQSRRNGSPALPAPVERRKRFRGAPDSAPCSC